MHQPCTTSAALNRFFGMVPTGIWSVAHHTRDCMVETGRMITKDQHQDCLADRVCCARRRVPVNAAGQHHGLRPS